MDAVVKTNKEKEVKHIKCPDLKISITPVDARFQNTKLKHLFITHLLVSDTKKNSALLLSQYDKYFIYTISPLGGGGGGLPEENVGDAHHINCLRVKRVSRTNCHHLCCQDIF